MLRLQRIWLTLTLPLLLASVRPASLVAQDDPNETPLGDVARKMRRTAPPPKDVIDNDNLPKVMDEAESHHPWGSLLKVLTGGDGRSHPSTPNVTCSLSFSANLKSLASTQYAQMDLPASEVQKLQGPASIEGGALKVSVFNGTEWHVSEVAVALTIVKKTEPSEESLYDASAYTGLHSRPYGSSTAALPGGVISSEEPQARPEKKSDVTVIYRMRAAAPPSATTVFTSPLNLTALNLASLNRDSPNLASPNLDASKPDLAPDQEWHWAIVQATGYPPQYEGSVAQTTAQTDEPPSVVPGIPDQATVVPRLVPASMSSQSTPAASRNPQ